MLPQACPNGDRSVDDHPACPVTPSQLAADAVAAAGAGAVPAVTAAVRLPLGVATGAWLAMAAERIGRTDAAAS